MNMPNCWAKLNSLLSILIKDVRLQEEQKKEGKKGDIKNKTENAGMRPQQLWTVGQIQLRPEAEKHSILL